MAKATTQKTGLSTPILAMLLMAIIAGLIVGASFEVITHWPLPVSVAPYFEDNLFGTGFVWGFVVGGLMGWIFGFITDEEHFTDVSY